MTQASANFKSPLDKLVADVADLRSQVRGLLWLAGTIMVPTVLVLVLNLGIMIGFQIGLLEFR